MPQRHAFHIVFENFFHLKFNQISCIYTRSGLTAGAGGFFIEGGFGICMAGSQSGRPEWKISSAASVWTIQIPNQENVIASETKQSRLFP